MRLALTLEHSVWRAVIAKDGDVLASLFSDDYIEITLSGKRVEKNQVVEESPKSDEITAYAIDSAKVVLPSDGVLLLSYHLTIHGTYWGDPILPRERWATSIWRSRVETWKCCFFQQSPFPMTESGNS